MSLFVHLHCQSDYSFLNALPKPSELAKKAKEEGMTHIALTDRANTHGLVEFFTACQKNDIKPILGSEFYVSPRSRNDKEAGIDSKRNRIILIAINNTGYKNILSLSTTSFTEGMYYVPRIDLQLLEEKKEGLIAILPRSGGEMTPFFDMGDIEAAKPIYDKYFEIFGKNLYVETTPRPHLESESIFQKSFKEAITTWGAQPVASNDIRYIEKEDNHVHDTLLCMQYSLQKNEPDRISNLEHDLSFLSAHEMETYFSDIPESISNTKIIADQCEYTFTFGENLIPRFPIPENFSNDKDYLRYMCEEGVKKRYTSQEANMEEVKERLNFELQVIDQMGFNSYFLIVADFVQWAKDEGIAVGPGRGSAAGSIVSYLLSITDLDPLKYGLYFERFLNPERVSMPDIDLDFADTRREEVLEYVRKKYGYDHVAQICTFGTMAARASIKDVGRAFGIPFGEMNELAKTIPEKPGTTLDEAFEQSKELRDKIAESEEIKTIFDTAKKIEGNTRHISVHACAVIIAPEPIVNYSALQPAPKDPDSIITQYQAKPLEMLGLLKMDFLGLRNLTILEKTLQHIKKRHGKEIDMSSIPMDDKKTFELLSQGETTGVFQLESAGMTRYLKELRPSHFEDLIAMVSLYRPGPMKFIPDYINGKHGKKKVKYPHPSLEKVLAQTFGIAVYQEQILEIAKIFGGFSLGGADLLRRAIGKKIASELAAQREKFIQGAQEQGHSEKLAIEIFDDVIEPFAGYGFNKSHAACYALIAYHTAYLKAHYPVEFIAGLLSCDEENTDRVILDIESARRMNIEVLPPSASESDATFTILDDHTIRFGLNAIKGIGESIVEKIIEARNQSPFENFADLLSKCGSKAINKKSLEALAKSGALSEYEKVENILGQLEKILEFTKNNGEKPKQNQDDLFGSFDITIEVQDLQLDDEIPYSHAYKLRLEKEVLGIYVSDHPLRGMKRYFKETATPIKGIPKAIRNSKTKEVKIQGLLSGIRKIITKKKTTMAIGTLEDISGKIDIVLFPKTYDDYSDQLGEDKFAKITAKADKRDGEYQAVISSIESFELEEIREDALKKGLLDEYDEIASAEEFQENIIEEEAETPEEISEREEINDQSSMLWSIPLPTTITKEKLESLKALLSLYPGEKAVEFLFQGKSIAFHQKVQASETLEKQVEKILGE